MSLQKTAESGWGGAVYAPPPREDPQLSPPNQAHEGFFVAAVPPGEEERGARAPARWDRVPRIWGARHPQPQRGEQGGDKSPWPLSKAG